MPWLDLDDADDPGACRLPTRKQSALEIEELVEPERRYTPEPGETCEPPPPGSDAPRGARERRCRTVRMRVLDFQPLPRPPPSRRDLLARLVETLKPGGR